MGQPWGISGPEFLGLYVAGTAGVVFISSAWCSLVALATGRSVSHDLSPAEVGYLAGGPLRAAEVMIAERVESGAWRVSSAGLITQATGEDGMAAGGFPWPGMAPVSAVGSTARVRRRLKADAGVAGIRRALRADGQVPSASQVAVMWAGSAALYLALLVVGLLRVLEGRANHRPVSDLVGLIVIALVVVPLVLRRRVASAARATRSGRRYVRRLRRAVATGRISRTAPAGLAMAGAPDGVMGAVSGWGTTTAAGAMAGTALLGVALIGFAGVPDPMTRAALLAGLPSASGGGSDGGGGDGGGCGGGGCGGGCGG